MQKKPRNFPNSAPGNTLKIPPIAKNTGQYAEDLACAHLLLRGLTLLQRNYRCGRGEIDLIMKDNSYLVFIEVRYRATPRYGSGAESITPQKRTKLIATALHFLQSTNKYDRYPSRFDVISVSDESGQKKIEWIQDAFQA